MRARVTGGGRGAAVTTFDSVRRGALVVTSAAVLVLVAGVPGRAAGPQPTGWDGANPFLCTLQNAGTGTTVAHPEADPFCVEYEKRHQNVDQLGIVDFLSKEPARVAMASPKCFYFQSDHWRGSALQDSQATKTYEWDGHYFFNKATGEGGAWVTNFNVNGHTADPSAIPGIPREWSRYLGPGTGGVIIHDDFPADPACAARVRPPAAGVYAAGSASRGSAPAFACAIPTGAVNRRSLGPVALGDPERKVRRLLGDPALVRGRFLHYCQRGAGKYLVGFPARGGAPSRRTTGSGSDAPTVMLLTTNPGYALRGVRRGSPAALFTRRFPSARPLFRQGRTRVWRTAPGSRLLVGVRHRRVRYLALYAHGAIRAPRVLRRFLRGAVIKDRMR